MKNRKKRPLLMDLSCLLLCFYLISAMVLVFRDKLVLHPMVDTSWESMLDDLTRITGGKVSRLKIAKAHNPKISLDALYLKMPTSSKVFIITHGNAGNLGHRLGLLALLASSGNSVLVFDYQGYGASEGKASLDNLLGDGIDVFDYARNELNYKKEQIILYGESIGCGVASGVAQARPPAALVLQSGFTSLEQVAKDKMFFLHLIPGQFFPQPRLDNLAYVQTPHPPILFIHGDKDTILPEKYTRQMYDKALPPKSLYISKGQGHNDIGVTDAGSFVPAIKDFLKTL
jgi:fermentation-respiration switch protein FrsA (DUF1100 family)